MNDSQIFEAIGLIFLLVWAGGLLNPTLLKKVLESFAQSIGLMFLSGMIAVFLGYVMLSYHGSWNWNPSLVITIFGWVAIIKWAALMIFPEWAIGFSKALLKRSYLNMASPIIGVVGILLLWMSMM